MSKDGKPPENSDEKLLNRRNVLKSSMAIGTGMTSLSGCSSKIESPVSWDTLRESRLYPVGSLPRDATRQWIGPSFWANRLQDWRLHDGRVECLCGKKGYEIRTVNVLTREIVAGHLPGHIQATIGITGNENQKGFCGFLLGIGNGQLDYRAAALAQHGSGVGGGILCTLDRSGKLSFREHTNESKPLEFAELQTTKEYSESPPIVVGSHDEIRLSLDIIPEKSGFFTVQLIAHDAFTEAFLGKAIMHHVPDSRLLGGISLVSSPEPNQSGTRWWFQDLQTGGEKVATYPDRTFGPIAGTQYSVDSEQKVLRLSAQFLPIGSGHDFDLFLEYRPTNTNQKWIRSANTGLQPGYTTLFRIDDWDSSHEWEYRVVYKPDEDTASIFSGRIQKDPGPNADDFRIGLFSCAAPTAQGLEVHRKNGDFFADQVGRYTDEYIYFPYNQLVQNAQSQDADFLVFSGDQIYQDNPTEVTGKENPTLDYLYKWYLWIWAFRDLVRDIPSVVLVDDHDVYQQNLWGEKGKQAPQNNARKGGYVGKGDFINLVQRTQCNHNPDPFDPTPVKRGIDVYYTSFLYGGVDFALVEDRKFKSNPPKEKVLKQLDFDGVLLGERQKQFLHKWIAKLDNDSVPICLSQSLYGCVETTPDGLPAIDLDSNGYPPRQRDDAVNILQKAGALVLSGDRHLASLVRHGVDHHSDGMLEFSGPACAAIYQRWFNPKWSLKNGRSQPNTGDFTDIFGNKVRVLAVANPKIDFDTYRSNRHERGQAIRDRDLKREGYGLVQIDHTENQCLIECWPRDEDPTSDTATQFPGWPISRSFNQIKKSGSK
ncbi:alkaline phosphatase D family protein [Haladaptatus caseinilyticus]|uniref:alkaline phosphatase D family protein n=1 Tax=Haladaptatus caseinilyticus TaxID=2993314 RepID=UPI00224B1DB0|nr:alkaline phosphatase D family protein [Haladaptatus caseinilyticus]